MPVALHLSSSVSDIDTILDPSIFEVDFQVFAVSCFDLLDLIGEDRISSFVDWTLETPEFVVPSVDLSTSPGPFSTVALL